MHPIEAGGSIVIDGEDVGELDLTTLRGRIGIIPQARVTHTHSCCNHPVMIVFGTF